MKTAALYSGGKDSTYAILLAQKLGHNIEYLATIHSKNPESYMYHTPNIGLTVMQSEVLNIKLVSKESLGEKEKEVHDLQVLLDGLDVEGVICGAISSKYQKERVEKICKELNLKLIAPLWGKDPVKLLRDMIKKGFEIIVVAVAAEGFDESWLGRRIDEKCIKDLIKLNKKHNINVSGEGGEFETVVLDCPLFNKKIKVTDSEKKWEGNSGFLEIKDVKLLEK